MKPGWGEREGEREGERGEEVSGGERGETGKEREGVVTVHCQRTQYLHVLTWVLRSGETPNTSLKQA